MASRTTFSELSSPPVTGAALLEEYADRMKTLFDASALPLKSVAGTANAVTATLDPPLDGGGLVDGMKFEITWAAANTGGVTLALNGGLPVSVLDASGGALAAGSVGSGLRSLLEYIGGAFRILSPLLTSLGGGSQRYFWQFTASGTWNKPSGLDDDTMVVIEAWGGGGGGGSGPGGGGGGGYARREMRVADLPSSVAVTIGAGGSVSSRGGNTTFGSLLTAYNGGAGSNTNGSSGGGGGGELGQGSNASTSTSGVAGGQIGGGRGAGSSSTNRDADALSIWGGGGGGYLNTVAPGAAVYGGGGGAGYTGSSGGLSLRGGNGGASGAAGTAPGGGGGWNAAGARGEVRVWI